MTFASDPISHLFTVALVGAFSVIVKTGCGTDGVLHRTSADQSALSTVLHQ